ncbi:MAG: nucleotidyltransferase family protein [Candidatus Pacearchaeota archaeon]|nr:nucleotidyltransferase family protein [Candidatus Pacearchaeota archaeon]
MKCIIVCGGYATRLYPLTENQPKALLHVKGKPIVDYLVEKINQVKDIDSIYLISNNKFYMKFAWWLSSKKFPKSIDLVDTGSVTVEDQLGPIHDCLMAIDQFEIKEDILILYGDNLFSLDINEFINFFKEKKATCLACYKIDNPADTKKFGIVTVDENKKIIKTEEKPEKSDSNLAVTGIYMIRKEDIPKLKEFHKKSEEENKLSPGWGLTYFIKDLYEKQDVYAFPFSGDWIDIGSKEDYEKIK